MHVALTNHPVLHSMDKPAFIRLQSFGALEVFSQLDTGLIAERQLHMDSSLQD
jgi:hypothetical protein